MSCVKHLIVILFILAYLKKLQGNWVTHSTHTNNFSFLQVIKRQTIYFLCITSTVS